MSEIRPPACYAAEPVLACEGLLLQGKSWRPRTLDGYRPRLGSQKLFALAFGKDRPTNLSRCKGTSSRQRLPPAGGNPIRAVLHAHLTTPPNSARHEPTCVFQRSADFAPVRKACVVQLRHRPAVDAPAIRNRTLQGMLHKDVQS